MMSHVTYVRLTLEYSIDTLFVDMIWRQVYTHFITTGL